MNKESTAFSTNDLLVGDWSEAINALETNDPHLIADEFANFQNDNGSENQNIVLLRQLCWMMLVPEDEDGPYKPMMVAGDSRSLLPEDIKGEQTESLSHLIYYTSNPAFKARIADVCFQNSAKIKHTRDAVIPAYLACLERIKANPQANDIGFKNLYDTNSLKYIRRVMQISNRMRRDDHSDISVYAKQAFEDAIGAQSPFGSCRAAVLCADYDFLDNRYMASKIDSLLGQFGGIDQHHEREALLERGAQLYQRAGDEQNSERMLSLLATEFEKQADVEASAMVKVHRLDSAIKTTRRLPRSENNQIKIQELRDKRRDIQPDIRSEMSTFSQTVDVGDEVKEIYEKFSSFNLRQAFLHLAFLRQLPTRHQLEEDGKETAQSGPLMSLFSMTTVDDAGQPIHVAEGLDFSGPETEEAWLRLFEYRERMYRSFFVQAQLYPALQAMRETLAIGLNECRILTASSAFVAHGHEFSTAKGLLLFLRGDSVSSASILIPKLEAFLRTVLSEHGVNVTNDIEQWQEGFSLNKILVDHAEKINEVFGEEISAQLELVFNYKGGPNVRNQVAHGLATDGRLFGHDTTYAVWMIVRLIITPLLNNDALPMWKAIEDSIG